MNGKVGTLKTVEALVEALQPSLTSRGYLIGVDGFMQAGKTTLAFELAEQLQGIRVSLDAFADRDMETEDYVQKIRVRYLASDLNKLRAAFPVVVTDGICLLQVLEAVSTAPDTLIYVKRISGVGLWNDGLHLEDYEAGDNVRQSTDGLRRSELEYHVKWRTHESANIFYERRERNGA
jgi:uridine kinase